MHLTTHFDTWFPSIYLYFHHHDKSSSISPPPPITASKRRPDVAPDGLDWSLIFSSMTLLLLGLVMVASASINVAQVTLGEPWYYFWRQLGSAGVGIVLAVIVLQIPIEVWQRWSVPLLLTGLGLLILVLIPGLGHEVKGSLRWLRIGAVQIQPSELMKVFLILYLAGYLVRRREEVRESVSGFVKPLMVVCVITGLLILEPDYGTIVVLFGTVLGMLFLAGVPGRQFLLWVVVVTVVLFGVMMLAPYRVQRLTTFVNPWADPFASGFQLTQALIAIGRGGWLGVGLGNSVQKLTSLPEAHTDFLFAILAEELGLVGVMVVMGLFGWIVYRAFAIARQAERAGLEFASYVASGIGLALGLQMGINVGVNLGLLPTKGLTLPLMSYGGSSVVVTCVMIGLLVKICQTQKSTASTLLS
jgi:cell division protein FtsW